ncbi:MAG: retropepsin-like aspartic protease [Phaeodactylibacter sp.]|uniref:retropepsin-like aspartic protease n=1 Tax=Phaeodactylibacter sp. TaxID=1940289 RepID=UPI0032EEFF3E
MKSSLIVFFVLLLNLPVQGQKEIARIPIAFLEGLMFIELRLNEKADPLNFLFDTGAGITAIDSAVSTALGLEITDEISIGTAGKSIRSGISANNRVRIGTQVTLDSVEIAIMDLSHLSQYFKNQIDGIIGSDLLQNFVTETDNDAQEIRFYAFEGFEPGENWTGYDIIGLEAGHFGIPLEITTRRKAAPRQMIFKIDTGADNALTFHNGAVTQHKLLESVNRRIKSKQGFGADSTVTNNLSSKLFAATFNGKEWRRVSVVFEVDPISQTSERLADGLIGQALLLDFNTTYDLQRGVVYFENRK